jgi:hypothetical protein
MICPGRARLHELAAARARFERDAAGATADGACREAPGTVLMLPCTPRAEQREHARERRRVGTRGSSQPVRAVHALFDARAVKRAVGKAVEREDVEWLAASASRMRLERAGAFELARWRERLGADRRRTARRRDLALHLGHEAAQDLIDFR